MSQCNEDGFTLLDILIGIALVGILVAVIISIFIRFQSPMATPEELLQEFSHNANITPIGCSDKDTDWDGYVSCTARDNITKQLVDVQCASSYFNSGCKLSKSKVVDN